MRRLSLFAALPLILLLLSLGAMGLSSHLVPAPEHAPPPLPSDGVLTGSVGTAPPSDLSKDEPDTMPSEHSLPYLLYSATDEPPLASQYYDLLFAQDPSPSPSADGLILSRSELPEGGALILRKDLSARGENGLELRNETAYSPDLRTLASASDSIPTLSVQGGLLGKGEEADPIVLIYHTHATEAFLPEDATYIAPSRDFRSSDPAETVVALGAVIAELLNQAGIPTVHCTVMHDEASYSDAYERSRESIKAYLAAYPSIRYILDIHRDALITVDGDYIRPVLSATSSCHGLQIGRDVAQIMLVVGTDEGGAHHPDWQTNLSLACKLQAAITASIPGLMRPIQLRSASFLAQYAPGALLVEIGSCANTLSQAMDAARVFGGELAAFLTGGSL